MDEGEFRKLVRRVATRHRLKVAAAGVKHERLRAELDRWAREQGYTAKKPGGLDGKLPDVLRRHGKGLWFVGDAKDSDNETTSRADSLERIAGYFQSFARRIIGGQLRGGLFAICTDTSAAANGWRRLIDVMAAQAGVSRGDGKLARVKKIDSQTFIAYW
jgi:hypothetical protein